MSKDDDKLECVFCNEKIDIGEDGKVIEHKIGIGGSLHLECLHLNCPMSGIKVETYKLLLENYLIFLEWG